ncbi:MAG: NIPSNAP family protein [Alphaproteobacteria bacterium]|nr:NIPSNAP family protein [Alphaproteobacteria bacterium]
MIYELRTYTLKAGSIPAMLKANEDIGRPVRGDNYGKLEGYWFTDIGPLNQVMHLWSYDNMAERDRLRKELGSLDAWVKEYIPVIRPSIIKQELRFMEAHRDLSPPNDQGNFYEFRNYRIKPGNVGEWMKRFVEVMPTRELYSKNICAWITQSPDPNEVCHLWAYKDTNERKIARDGVLQEAAWKEFSAYGAPLLVEMTSTLLWPASFSPLK